MRRRWTAWVSAALIVFLTTAFSATVASAAGEVVIAGWTGGYDKIFEEKILAEFLKQRGLKIRWILGTSVGNIAKVKATQGSPEIDIVLADDIPQRAALNEGLWEPLDPGIVTNLASLRPVNRLPGDQGVGLDLNILGIVYHRDVFKEKNLPPPTSWNDFFRKDLHKRVLVPTITTGEGLMMLIQMARLAGGNERNVDPGFAKLKELAPSVLEFTRAAAIQNSLLQRGEGWMTIQSLATASLAKQKGVPIEFVFPKEGSPARMATINVVKNGPNKRIAQEVVNYILGERAQEVLAEELKTAPANRHAKVPPDIAAMLDKLYPLDIDYINSVRPAWTERWNKEIEGK
jgi:putative spermidine/putrescine transport system substrate-binding protein